MKMKEVLTRTGLTERTVRFYEEQGLIEPGTTRINGRDYRDYSEKDVAELLTVRDLRKLFFTLEEIRDMKKEPGRIPEIVTAYKAKLEADAYARVSVVEAVGRLDINSLTQMSELARRLNSVAEGLQLPKRDVDPDFSRFDGITKETREKEFKLYQEKEEKRYRTGQAIVITIAVTHVITTLCTSFINFNLLTLIVQIALSIALVAGVSWIRYLFVIGSILSILYVVYFLFGGYASLLSMPIRIFVIFQMLFALASAVLLLKSRCVSEFLYAQKNG